MTFFVKILLCVVLVSKLMIADQDENVRAPRPDTLSYLGSTPQIVSPFDSAELQDIQQSVCQMNAILNTFLDCASIPIKEPMVITVPGSYCLTNNITGVIKIAVSGVTLGLNEFQVSGSLIIDPYLQNISISGGAVDSSLLSDCVTVGEGCDDIRISDLVLRNGVNGLTMAGTTGNPITNSSISQIAAESCFNVGIYLIECSANIANCISLNNNSGIYCSGKKSRVLVADSRSYKNDGTGFDFAHGKYKCVNCFSVLNGQIGFRIAGDVDPLSEASLNCEDCCALLNGIGYVGSPYGGFLAGNYTSMVAKDCRADSNLFGFFAVGGSNIEWINCSAKKNLIDGFMIYGDIDIISGLIMYCRSLENGNAGFDISPEPKSAVKFVANFATDSVYIDTSKANVNYAVGGSLTGGGSKKNDNEPPYYWMGWDNSPNAWRSTDGNYSVWR